MSYGFEWMPVLVLVGAFILLTVPAFALIGLVVVALAAVAALVALAGAILATPYLLVRALHRRVGRSAHSPQRTMVIDSESGLPAFPAASVGVARST